MEKLNTEEEIRRTLDKLDRKRKPIVLRSFLTLLIPIGAVAFIIWYSSTIVKESHVLNAANASLKATSAEQAQTIKQITDNFFKLTGELNDEIVSLREGNAALRKELQKLRR